jgi:hypothetical protein
MAGPEAAAAVEDEDPPVIRRQQRERPEARTGRDAVDAAARGAIRPEEAQSALEWLLDDEEDDVDVTETLQINVGGPEAADGTPLVAARPPRWIDWVIQPVDEGVLRRILRVGSGRRNRRGDEGADANLRVVVAGSPELAEAAREKGIADPGTLVRQRFRKKPGLIGQIADAIMELSGFNEEDVRESRDVRAAQG